MAEGRLRRGGYFRCRYYRRGGLRREYRAQAFVLRVDVALLDKEADVSFGVSKANSGIVHGGFHHNKKYLKARLEILGSMMFDRLKAELDFPFVRCGIVVAALHEDEMRAVEQLYAQGVENGVIGIEMCSAERMLELEPKLSRDAVGGLYAPGGGIVEPYRFVFSLVESAMKNGGSLFTDWQCRSAARARPGRPLADPCLRRPVAPGAIRGQLRGALRGRGFAACSGRRIIR